MGLTFNVSDSLEVTARRLKGCLEDRVKLEDGELRACLPQAEIRRVFNLPKLDIDEVSLGSDEAS